MTTASKTPPPNAQPPSRPPVQPRRPPNNPTSPPIDPPSKGLADDAIFAALDEILDDLKTPAQPLSSAAAGPVKPRAGGPPVPGADFRLPRDVRLEVGTGPVYDALPRRHNP